MSDPRLWTTIRVTAHTARLSRLIQGRWQGETGRRYTQAEVMERALEAFQGEPPPAEPFPARAKDADRLV